MAESTTCEVSSGQTVHLAMEPPSTTDQGGASNTTERNEESAAERNEPSDAKQTLQPDHAPGKSVHR